MRELALRVLNRVANEPVAVIAAGILSLAGWVGPLVVHNFDAAAFNAQFGTEATVLGTVIGLVARQFVSPTRKG